MTTSFENLSSDLGFGALMDRVAEYLRPFAAMWPFCWLKAVAVHEEDMWWRVCYLSLSGRWSDVPPPGVAEVEAPGEGIVIISRLMDTATTWQTFQSL